MKYYVTVSWIDKEQPLLREYKNLTAEIEDIASMSEYDIEHAIVQCLSYEYKYERSGFVVHFMMAMK